VAVYPLTATTNYRHVFYDVLTLDAANPKSTVWVGVSAADAQAYVPDELSTGALANRPGNESAIATCSVSARYRSQPVFSVPPPLGDVPEIVTDEPTGRQVLVNLDLDALLAGALPAGSPVALERCSADDILSRTSLAGGQVVVTHPDGTTEVVDFPNPGDHAAVIDALSSDDPQRIANRYLLHLVAGASDPLVFFARTSGVLDSVGLIDDRLAPKPGRFLYAVRAGDSLGGISDGGAVLPVVVRVPSTAGATRPLKRALTTTDDSLTLTVAVPADRDTTTLLLFITSSPPHTDPVLQTDAELLRIPNRRDLYPHNGLRMRLADGALLPPAVVKFLSDSDVTSEAGGTRVARLTVAATHQSWATVWCYALTSDGFPSFVCGPFSTGVGT
jgi:hypothetical protein